jgi:hypothetical protein
MVTSSALCARGRPKKQQAALALVIRAFGWLAIAYLFRKEVVLPTNPLVQRGVIGSEYKR